MLPRDCPIKPLFQVTTDSRTERETERIIVGEGMNGSYFESLCVNIIGYNWDWGPDCPLSACFSSTATGSRTHHPIDRKSSQIHITDYPVGSIIKT